MIDLVCVMKAKRKVKGWKTEENSKEKKWVNPYAIKLHVQDL